MEFKLDNVVPWGRSYDEYVHMFDLGDDDLKGHILGCADGPASFNTHARANDCRVTSADPIYKFTPDQIRLRIEQTCNDVLVSTIEAKDNFRWDTIKTPEDLVRIRMQAMTCFLDDFSDADAASRYVAAQLPRLPFSDNSFDLVLCSHFLFLYSQHLSRDFHAQAILELCRLAPEVRIFPLVDLAIQPSEHLPAMIKLLNDNGYLPEVKTVGYEFQRGGNQMLRITRNLHTF